MKAELKRAESQLAQERAAHQETRLKCEARMSEMRLRVTEIETNAIEMAGGEAREISQRTLELKEAALEAQARRFHKELEEQQKTHAIEMEAVKKRVSESDFISSMAKRVETGAQSLDALNIKVTLVILIIPNNPIFE